MICNKLLWMALAIVSLATISASPLANAQTALDYGYVQDAQPTEWGVDQIDYQVYDGEIFAPELSPNPSGESEINPPIPREGARSILSDRQGGYSDSQEDATSVIEGEVIEGDYGGYESIVHPNSTPLGGSNFYTAPIESSGTWLRNGCWYTQQEFVMLNRNNLRAILLARDSFTGSELTTLSSSHQFEPGARITLGRVLGRDKANREHALEFTFYGLFDWSTTAALVSPTSGTISSMLGITSGTSPFATADSQSYTYKTEFNSFELNMLLRRRPDRDALVLRPDGHWIRNAPTTQLKTFLFGIRAASVNDQFIIRSDDGADNGIYNVSNDNDLIGLQFGGEFREQFPNWSWGMRGKLGALVNLADRNSRLDTLMSGSSSFREETLGETNLSFLAEANVYAEYQVRPNLSFYAQYNLVYLSGIGSAADNLGLGTSFPSLNLESGLLMQGASFGFSKYW